VPNIRIRAKIVKYFFISHLLAHAPGVFESTLDSAGPLPKLTDGLAPLQVIYYLVPTSQKAVSHERVKRLFPGCFEAGWWFSTTIAERLVSRQLRRYRAALEPPLLAC